MVTRDPAAAFGVGRLRALALSLLVACTCAACSVVEADLSAQNTSDNAAGRLAADVDGLSGDALCAQVEAKREAVEEAQRAVLNGVEIESITTEPGRCIVRLEAGDRWITLTYRPAVEGELAAMAPVNEYLFTDGATRSGGQIDGQILIVEAATSDPASISTWDASLVGVTSIN